MNQILITEKVYVTPELKRKKKIYKILFIVSLFAIVSLSSIYIYAEYDRNKEESMSQNILTSLMENNNAEEIVDDNALIVLITQELADEEIEQTAPQTAVYTAPNGKQYEYIGTINIPKINVNYPILSSTSVKLLKVSPCKFHGGSPNEIGNLCIVGHNYRNNKLFSKVPTLEIGDIIEITDLSQRTLQYEIYDMHTVLPNNTDDTTQKTNGRKEITVITCTDDSKQRVIVKCKEKI